MHNHDLSCKLSRICELTVNPTVLNTAHFHVQNLFAMPSLILRNTELHNRGEFGLKGHSGSPWPVLLLILSTDATATAAQGETPKQHHPCFCCLSGRWGCRRGGSPTGERRLRLVLGCSCKLWLADPSATPLPRLLPCSARRRESQKPRERRRRRLTGGRRVEAGKQHGSSVDDQRRRQFAAQAKERVREQRCNG